MDCGSTGMESKLYRLLYKEGYVNERNSKVVESGIKRIQHLVQDIALALLAGCLMKSIGVSIVMEIIYFPLRCYSGGYHASSDRVCKYLSWGSAVGCLVVINFVPIPINIQHLLIIFSVACIMILAPVESCKKPLYDRERVIFRRRCLLVTVAVLLFYGGMVFGGVEIYAKTICISVVMVSIGVIAGRFFDQTEIRNEK